MKLRSSFPQVRAVCVSMIMPPSNGHFEYIDGDFLTLTNIVCGFALFTLVSLLYSSKFSARVPESHVQKP